MRLPGLHHVGGPAWCTQRSSSLPKPGGSSCEAKLHCRGGSHAVSTRDAEGHAARSLHGSPVQAAPARRPRLANDRARLVPRRPERRGSRRFEVVGPPEAIDLTRRGARRRRRPQALPDLRRLLRFPPQLTRRDLSQRVALRRMKARTTRLPAPRRRPTASPDASAPSRQGTRIEIAFAASRCLFDAGAERRRPPGWSGARPWRLSSRSPCSSPRLRGSVAAGWWG